MRWWHGHVQWNRDLYKTRAVSSLPWKKSAARGCATPAVLTCNVVLHKAGVRYAYAIASELRGAHGHLVAGSARLHS